jgi:hypothetical protein
MVQKKGLRLYIQVSNQQLQHKRLHQCTHFVQPTKFENKE